MEPMIRKEITRPKDVAMLILGIQNEITGFTRFIKYLFLVDKSGIFKKSKLTISWRPYYYGPYWDGFDKLVDTLSDDGLLDMNEVSNFAGNSTTVFSITVKGRKYFQSLILEYEDEFKNLTSLIRSQQNKSLTMLLKFIYEQYPDFAMKSRIKSKILDEQSS